MKVSETFWLTVIGMLQYASIAAAAILFYCIPKNGRRPYLELGLLLTWSVLTETIGWIGVLVLHQNMNVTNNIFNFLNLPLIIFLYCRHIVWPKKTVTAYILSIIFIVFAVINMFVVQGVNFFNSYTTGVASFVFIIMSITYIFGYASQLSNKDRLNLPMFWISLSILIYNGTTIYIHIWQQYLLNVVKSNFISVWMFHNSVGLIYYGIIFYALLLIRSQYILRNSTLD